jgi:GT2 family glycosyltransferase
VSELGNSQKTLLIVVTYKSFEFFSNLAQTISYFEDSLPGNHVMVIENSNDDRWLEISKSTENLIKTTVHICADNLGFAPAVNYGFKLAQDQWGTFDFIILMNPDVIIDERVLYELQSRALSIEHEKRGVFSVNLRTIDGKIEGGARRNFNRRRLFSHLCGSDSVSKLLGTSTRQFSEFDLKFRQDELGIVSGALMCIKAEVFGSGLDTTLPMYFEDNEICYRSFSRGYGLMLFEDLNAIHYLGHSRKSELRYERALQTMSVIEAPALVMTRLQGYSLADVRMVAFLGGFGRLLSALLIALFRLNPIGIDSSKKFWLRRQLKLGTWIILWSFQGKLHTNGVSMSEYLEEYSI